MAQIKIEIDEMLTYTIELNDVYSVKNFILIFDEHLSKLKKLIGAEEKNVTTKFHKNKMFNKLDLFVEKLGNDIVKKDGSTMRSFRSVMKVTGKAKGLVWLKPAGSSLVIYLRKGNYENIDPRDIIIYSTSKSKTFGDYPMIKTNDPSDIAYIGKIIRNIYNES